MAKVTVRNLLVVEGSSGGLLTLLAHSAASDLADSDGPVAVTTAISAAQGIAALTSEPVQCVVIDLNAPYAPGFLDQVAGKAELRGVPILAQADDAQRGEADDRLRGELPALRILPSLDEVRKGITAHLAATPARAGAAPALIMAEPVMAVPAEAEPAFAVPPIPEQARPQQGCAGLEGRKALIVDDDPRNVFAISSTLQQYGMRVTEASSGQEGISALLAEPDIDVVLMDIMMPGMDGYATMTVIRQMPDFARLPIITVTARAMHGDRDKSIAAGATDYVTKPVDPEELLSCIERWI
jgi:CheY-like chemotaxis protein